MDPVSGMLLGGAALGGLNSLLGAGASAVDAALQYHYAKKMYQHRYQWAMKDMAKAGLNPVLAANGGNVSGMSSAPSTDFAGAVNSGVNSAMQAARTVSDLQAQQVTNDKTKAEEEYAKANTNNVSARTQWQSIQNGILTQQEKALVEDAQARATNNRALASLNSARAEFADQLALNEEVKSFNEAGASKYRNLNDFWNYQHNKRNYYARPSASEERNWWRAKQVLDSVGSGIGSAVGVGKFMRYMRYFR